jgi:methyltransferase (TIGR00027 family)
VLEAAGYSRTKTTTFIWEGVTMYLPEAAVDATLRSIARNSATGSRIVFDYFTERALRDPSPALRDVRKSVAAVGEPFVFGMPGDDVRSFVGQRGYSVISDFGSADLGLRYLPKGNTMPSPSANRICVAAVR